MPRDEKGLLGDSCIATHDPLPKAPPEPTKLSVADRVNDHRPLVVALATRPHEFTVTDPYRANGWSEVVSHTPSGHSFARHPAYGERWNVIGTQCGCAMHTFSDNTAVTRAVLEAFPGFRMGMA